MPKTKKNDARNGGEPRAFHQDALIYPHFSSDAIVHDGQMGHELSILLKIHTLKIQKELSEGGKIAMSHFVAFVRIADVRIIAF